jgi:hypothetical protein
LAYSQKNVALVAAGHIHAKKGEAGPAAGNASLSPAKFNNRADE